MQKKGVFLHVYERIKSRENFKTENFIAYSHCSIFLNSAKCFYHKKNSRGNSFGRGICMTEGIQINYRL